MWLDRSVMFPTLHATIRDILNYDEQTRAQFVLEPLAFPILISDFQTFGKRFIEQVSYLTRTFAFYIDKEYRKILNEVELGPSLNSYSEPTNHFLISAAGTSPPLPSCTSQQSRHTDVQHGDGGQQQFTCWCSSCTPCPPRPDCVVSQVSTNATTLTFYSKNQVVTSEASSQQRVFQPSSVLSVPNLCIQYQPQDCTGGFRGVGGGRF